MKNKSTLSLTKAQALRSICNTFGTEATQNKKKLLLEFSKLPINEVKVLQFYHDCLLFMLAYPENKELQQLTFSELARCVAIAKKIAEGNHVAKKLKMADTGIHHSYLTARFSFDLVNWLCNSYPENIRFYSCDAPAETQKEIIKLLLPSIHREAHDKDFVTLEKWLENSSLKDTHSLRTLMRFMESACPDQELREYFFETLQVYVQVGIEGELPSRSTATSEPDETFFHTENLIRKINPSEILSEKIKRPIPLSFSQKQHLNTVGRCSLLMLLRETDPITFSNVNATEWHDMGRGLKIALYYSKPERRMSVESYVGYMAFKNDWPLAYGGGWVLGSFSRIGVNVFEPFRGGESAWVFLQILRLYKQRFNISTFEAEPYQIGKNNTEGIKSGAFWFYHRLGFRPSQPELRKLADEEQIKINSKKGYRTEEKILKKLADSFMVLNLLVNEYQHLTSLEISEAVSIKVLTQFAGMHGAFMRYATIYVLEALDLQKEALDTNSSTFRNLAALICLIPDLSSWSKADKKRTIQLFKLKEAESECNYILALQKHQKLGKELRKVLHETN